MRRRRDVIAGAATAVAALGLLVGCAVHKPAPEPATAPAPPPTTTAVAPAPGGLPAPEELTEVLYRLADPAVPGVDKLALVDGATADDAATLDNFAQALQDNGYTPPTFEASELAWADAEPADVVATITADKPEPDGGFSLPMEFTPYRGGWQLSRDTFDMLLNLQAPAPPR